MIDSSVDGCPDRKEEQPKNEAIISGILKKPAKLTAGSRTSYIEMEESQKKEEKTVEDRKNGQKRQPETRRPEEDRAHKPIELDPDQMEKVSGGAPSIPPEWLMKDE